jgi:hypothetical protein
LPKKEEEERFKDVLEESSAKLVKWLK